MSRSITEIIDAPFREGMQQDMPFTDYLSHRGLSGTVIAAGCKSLLSAQHKYSDMVPKVTDAQVFGSVGHTLLLEPDTFNATVAVWNGGRRYGKKWDEFCDEHDGKHIIAADGKSGFGSVSGAIHSALSRPEVKRIVQSGVAELSMFTVEQGMQCKGRIDWISNSANCIADVKFTTNVESHAFYRNAYSRFRYGLKMGVYRKWFERVTNRQVGHVCLIVIEQEPPHDVAVVPIPDSELERGWCEAQRVVVSIRKMIDRLGNERWPGVDGGSDTYELFIPPWEMEEPQLEGVEEYADEAV